MHLRTLEIKIEYCSIKDAERIVFKALVSTPIDVQKLLTGGYEIVNGHHRWLAAQKAGLKRVLIRIKNYNN